MKSWAKGINSQKVSNTTTLHHLVNDEAASKAQFLFSLIYKEHDSSKT